LYFEIRTDPGTIKAPAGADGRLNWSSSAADLSLKSQNEVNSLFDSIKRSRKPRIGKEVPQSQTVYDIYLDTSLELLQIGATFLLNALLDCVQLGIGHEGILGLNDCRSQKNRMELPKSWALPKIAHPGMPPSIGIANTKKHYLTYT
jgi:hypothetical protein